MCNRLRNLRIGKYAPVIIARVDDFDMPEHHARACQNRQPVLFHRHPGQTYGVVFYTIGIQSDSDRFYHEV